MPTFFAIVILNTPNIFLSEKAACIAWYTTFAAAPNKLIWRIDEDPNIPGQPRRTKMKCQAPVLVTPPTPAPYTDYPVIEE